VQAHLNVSVREQGESVVVELCGELDLASSSKLEQALNDTWRAKPRLLVLELAKLHFIDMAGLRVLLGAQQQAMARSAQMVLSGVRPNIRRVMALAQVDDLLTVLETGP
jgi:anti-anti-sigma factor